MCGIAGVVGYPLGVGSHDRITQMKSALVRRGPDSEGTTSWPSAILGHRRLAIFDTTAAGAQPMHSDDGQIGVVFNGSIYNFKDLRGELETFGYRFRSKTDTEVLVHGYERWGIDALVEKLRGMFAFAVWDNRKQKLFLVRDRLGVKPLLYSANGQTIAFASTLDALREGGFANRINDAAVADFLEFGWVADHHCMFLETSKVPAASIVEWSKAGLSQRCYWQAHQGRHQSAISFTDAVEKTEELLLDSVRIRLAADVPVGALLSGGIDSALVCWAMSRLGADIQAFTIRTAGLESDESEQARETARLLAISHQMIDLPPAGGAPITDLISAYGEPFASASALGMLRVSRAVKPKVTVLLTGDGGDDVFLGYPRHLHMWWAQTIARGLPGPVAAMWPALRRTVARRPRFRRPMHLLDYATQGLSAASVNPDSLSYYQRRSLLAPRLQAAIEAREIVSGSITSARRVLQEFLEHEWRTQFVGEYMTKVDGSTMFHGIEARSPFLDHVLWEFAASLPYNIRLRNGRLKAVLRQIVSNRIGPEVANRKKRGFNIPVERWLSKEWGADLQGLAKNSRLVENGWIDGSAIRVALHEARNQQSVPPQLWRMLVLEHWMREKCLGVPIAASA